MLRDAVYLTATERDVLQLLAQAAGQAAAMLFAAGETRSPMYELAMRRCEDFRALLADDEGPASPRFCDPQTLG